MMYILCPQEIHGILPQASVASGIEHLMERQM